MEDINDTRVEICNGVGSQINVGRGANVDEICDRYGEKSLR